MLFFLFGNELPSLPLHCLLVSASCRYRNPSTMWWRSDPYWLPSASCAQRTGPSCSLQKLGSHLIRCSLLFLTHWWETNPSCVRRYHQKPPSSALLCHCSNLSSQRIMIELCSCMRWSECSLICRRDLAFWVGSQHYDQSDLFLPILFLLE